MINNTCNIKFLKTIIFSISITLLSSCDGSSENSELRIGQISAISTGANYILILDDNHNVWGSGSNEFGQLGSTTSRELNNFVHIASNTKKIHTSNNSSFLIKLNGDLYSSGYNGGKLGNSSLVDQKSFKKVASNVSQVQSNYHCTAIIKNDSSLWLSGKNFYGHLGDGSQKDSDTFIKVLAKVKNIYLSFNNSYAIKYNSELWATGHNYAGALGDSLSETVYSFKKILDDIVYVSGDDNTFAVSTNGKLYVSGYNKHGELGNGNTQNQYGFSTNQDAVTKVEILGSTSFILKKDESLWHTGKSVKSLNYIKILDDVVHLSASGQLALKTDKSMWQYNLSDGKYVKVLDDVILISGGNGTNFLSVALTIDNQLWFNGNFIFEPNKK